jgi:hypothetical protein
VAMEGMDFVNMNARLKDESPTLAHRR